MTTKVAGSGFLGEKLVGNIDFFTVDVLTDLGEGGMPFLNTGVVATRDGLIESGDLSNATLSATNTITVVNPLGAFTDKVAAETIYTSNAAYDQAYAEQRNLDLLIEGIATKAQPILMSDTVVTASWPTDEFLGNSAGSTDEVTSFRFAVEHTAVFSDDPTGAGNPLAADAKAIGVVEIMDAVGDSLRANSVTPSGLDTWDGDVGGSNDNFIVRFAGTL